MFGFFIDPILAVIVRSNCPPSSPQGPRPSQLVLEKTTDNGRTWQPAIYFATDCRRAFPQVPTTTPLSLDETYCYTLPPTDQNPYRDHTVKLINCNKFCSFYFVEMTDFSSSFLLQIEFSPLRQYSYVSAPNSRKIDSECSGRSPIITSDRRVIAHWFKILYLL